MYYYLDLIVQLFSSKIIIITARNLSNLSTYLIYDYSGTLKGVWLFLKLIINLPSKYVCSN